MPAADGSFKGISVPADAWERIFGDEARVIPEVRELFDRPHPSSVRALYEEHLNVLGPTDHSPFIQSFRR